MPKARKSIEDYINYLKSQPNGFLYNDDNHQEGKPVNKQQELDDIKKKFADCSRCPLATQGRNQVVFGIGNPNAEIMFIGEGPGRDEDLKGEPFVGRAGKLLTKIIEAMGLTREEVYISNTVKCRPPNNRTPLPSESDTCINHILMKEISIIKPKVICALGATAAQALLGPDTRLSDVRGSFLPVGKSKLLVTYDPAYLLRNPPAKKFVWEDMLKILSLLGKKPPQRQH